jgi:prepilin-type N-terminal cleavage/methylation domain-containing protein/prepilin-type processing-associated H-X9-DG protein
MKTHLIKGFTLVELLVVISIIGMLSAALISYVPGAIEAGRALKCKANLKNLAQAASSWTINQTGNNASMPTAGSFEWTSVNTSTANDQALWYHSSGAWVSWTPSGQWLYSSKDVSLRDSMGVSTFYDKSRTDVNSKAVFSITNGVLWSYVGKDANVYLCDTHKKVLERQTSGRVHRSYVMNRYFGYDDHNSPASYLRWVHVDALTQSGIAAIRLMFAELPGQLGKTIDVSPVKADSVLDPAANEYLGFNHKIGKKWIAHVAFADGHVDGLVQPMGANTTDLKDLTEHLCNGEEIDATVRAKMQ